MSRVRRIGSDGEDLAADFLLGLGFTLLGRRIKMPSGELDIVAFEGEELVFVEVKQSAGSSPELRLDDQKAARVVAAAEEFALKHKMERHRMRFDLIAIEGAVIRHHRDAWRP